MSLASMKNLKFVDDYLGVEKMRLEDRLEVRWENRPRRAAIARATTDHATFSWKMRFSTAWPAPAEEDASKVSSRQAGGDPAADSNSQ